MPHKILNPRRSQTSGVFLYGNDWQNVPADDFRKSFEVNVISLIRICHRLIPAMVQRHWGRIINVTSGIKDQPELIAYAISKAAVDKSVADTVIRLRDSRTLVPVLIDDGTTGKLFHAQDFAGKTI